MALVGPVARRGNVLPYDRSECEKKHFGVCRKIWGTYFAGIWSGVIVNIDVPVVHEKVGSVEEQVDGHSAHHSKGWPWTCVVPTRVCPDSVTI